MAVYHLALGLVCLLPVVQCAVLVEEDVLQRRLRTTLENNQNTSRELSPEKLLNLKRPYSLKENTRDATVSGTDKIKYQQYYNGKEVVGSSVVLEKSNTQTHFTDFVHGNLIEGIEDDVKVMKPAKSASSAKSLAMKAAKEEREVSKENQFAKLVIYVKMPTVSATKDDKTAGLPQMQPATNSAAAARKTDAKAKISSKPAVSKPAPVPIPVPKRIPAPRPTAYLAYIVHYFVEGDNETEPANPLYVIDAMNGKVLDSWPLLQTFPYKMAGWGGNVKIGKYRFGTYRWSGKRMDADRISIFSPVCRMQNPYARIYNCGSSWSCPTLTTAIANCFSGANDPANGAYSPLNDALYLTKAAQKMLEEWYGDSVIPTNYPAMRVRVHYGTSYQNAFWSPSLQLLTFGDGASIFHPLVVADVVAHELGHAYTTSTSGLIYSQQSGGINEAFSDIIGEAFKHYLLHTRQQGANDWMLGRDATKTLEALRFMAHPPLDGKSVHCARNYYNGLGVHYSSGVYNKAFYLLVNKPAWGMKRAFQVFVRANKLYWGPSTNYNQGSCGVRQAAIDLGYSVADVEDAFAQVGVYCKCPPGYVQRNDWSCYKFVNDVASWAEARVYCKSIGSDLTSIEDSSEQYWIRNYIMTHTSSLNHESFSLPEFWVGGLDMAQEGAWKWPATNSDASYTFWHPTEPNNQQGHENCMALQPHYIFSWPWTWVWSYRWHDDDCFKQKLFVCEKSCK